MTEGDQTWYFAWLPGPWVRVRGPQWPQPPGFDDADHILEAECDICGERLIISSLDLDLGDRLQARIHWERHAEHRWPIPYFSLPGIGDLKTQSFGTWTDVILAVPYLLWEGAPIPPLSVVNEILGEGFHDAGMSGGCEWPRHVLSNEEYEVLRRELRDRGYLDLAVPEAVVTRNDYESWKRSVKSG